MKKNLITLVCLMGTLGSAPSLYAFQQDSSASSTSASPRTGGMPTPEDVVARLDSKLSLTSEQKSKITPIIADRQTQMRALMADGSGRRMQKARKAKSIMEESDQKIEAILTSDQKKKYEQMKEEMKEQMRARMQERQNSQY